MKKNGFVHLSKKLSIVCASGREWFGFFTGVLVFTAVLISTHHLRAQDAAPSASATQTTPPRHPRAARGDQSGPAAFPEANAARGATEKTMFPEVRTMHEMVGGGNNFVVAAGLRILHEGGNAVDAGVAATLAAAVTEEDHFSMGGEMPLIVKMNGKPVEIVSGVGTAPAKATVDFFNHRPLEPWETADRKPPIPAQGILATTTPGMFDGAMLALEKYGTMTFKQTLEPAARYAEQGFPVSERIANDWHLPKAVNANRGQLENCCSDIDPDSVKTWYIDGKQPVAGQIYKNPDLAKTFRILEAKGRDGFYKGSVAQTLVNKVRSLGGTMTMEDLANYKGEWAEPVMTDYHGYTLAELPPPSQGFAANEMLNILAACTGKTYPGQTLASLGPRDARYWHMLIEAKTLAYADLNRTNGDPNFNPNMAAQVRMLSSMAHANELCSKISPDKAMPSPGPTVPTGGDTIVLSTADRWGNMVSWVNSNYANFGSGITVPGYGFVLHNRGGLFTLDPNSPNVIAPHKRPYNTLAASFVLQGGGFNGQIMAMQLMGGDMQSQGHAQVVVNMVDLGANVQAASDMAFFHHNQTTDVVSLESEAFKLVGAQLQAMGHKVVSANGGGMGGYEAILFTPDPKEPVPDGRKNSQAPVNGTYRGGTDHRKDGAAIGW